MHHAPPHASSTPALNFSCLHQAPLSRLPSRPR
uniref:Uncharacterized protein n=1 Tax=Arundo donax TaxID=35708 RepID=A0A0A8YMB7_ARUDO